MRTLPFDYQRCVGTTQEKEVCAIRETCMRFISWKELDKYQVPEYRPISVGYGTDNCRIYIGIEK